MATLVYSRNFNAGNNLTHSWLIWDSRYKEVSRTSSDQLI